MAQAFARIAFTPRVREMQTRMGSRQAYRSVELGAEEPAELGAFEIAFIGERDSFYQGTVGENGWPYVQHRGGPVGFLKVLDARTIGYADFTGNRQYISVGNLAGDDRVSLFLMDYGQQRRLKIWGRARVVDEDTEPELLAQLESPDYRARVERGVVITVEAFDWNCPKHITPRYTEAEVRAVLARAQGVATVAAPERNETAALGTGPHELVVTGIRELSPRVRAYEFRMADRSDLPPVTAGAHLAVPVRLNDGTVVTRQYSVASNPKRRDAYEIAVLREDAEEGGRGGSAAIHDTWTIGTRIRVDAPANQFPLHEDARPAVLIAGGIGITPIKAMAQALRTRGARFELHYTGRDAGDMAYRDRLRFEFGDALRLYFTRPKAGAATRMDPDALVRMAPEDAVFYVCGPARLIDAVRDAAGAAGVAPARVQFESFE
jgi:ferredoxin-NADP reductase/predicted pyridoxine 5'-phosphate oxidase superfamily flavin-nucleotide-binding protein